MRDKLLRPNRISNPSAPAIDAEILSGLIAPDRPDFAPDVAHSVLCLKFSAVRAQRMLELAGKGNRGDLTEPERAEVESFRLIGKFLGLIQAKARLSLKHSSGASA